jgi:L-amino acid N-acyltransferase YncA
VVAEVETDEGPVVTGLGSRSPHRDWPAYTTSVEDSVDVCEVVSEGGHDSLTHLAFATEFEC